MRVGSRSLVALAAALLAGCTLLSGYPQPVTEDCGNHRDDDFDGLIDCRDLDSCARDDLCREAAACSDGHDQDLDDLVDCADPDCDGQCPEHDRNACGNHRDDDGDGRFDLADPGCWPFGVAQVTRCPSVRGTDVTLARLGDLISSGDALTEQPDPDDASHTVFGTTTPGAMATLRAASAEGVWDGTSVTTRVYLAGDGDAAITLGPIALTLTRAGVSIAAEEATGAATLATPAPAGWWTLALALSGDPSGVTITLDATPPGASARQAHVTPMHAWPRAGEAAIALRARVGASGAVLFDAVHVVRPSGVSCFVGPGSLDGVVTGAASLQGGACLAGFDPSGAPSAWVLVDGVLVQGGPITTSADLPFSPSPASDATGTDLRGVAPRADGSLVVLSAIDCVHFRLDGDAFASAPMLPPPVVGGDTPAPGIPGYGLGYTIRGTFEPGGPLHEISVAGTREGQRGFFFATSPTGAPRSFEVTSFRSLETLLDADTSERWRSQVSVTTIGHDHVYLVGRSEWLGPGTFADVLHVYVDSGDAASPFVEVDGALIGPSGIAGALDGARGVSAGLLLETTAPPDGFRAYVVHRNADPGTVSDVATLTILPPRTCENPMPETCNHVDDDCNGIVDDLGPELCDGIDEDCDGVRDEDDPDAAASCPPATSPFTGRGCGRVLVGATTHPVSVERFGCVEDYELTLGGSGSASCNDGYRECPMPATGCEAMSSDCYWVICAQRGCP